MSKQIKIGLVGLGRAGYSMHTYELASRKDKYVFVACCDEIPARVTAFTEQFGAKGYATIEELLTDPEVELVDIATRSIDHMKHAKMALLAGKNVFLEKPACMTEDEIPRLIEAERASRGRICVCFQNRTNAAVVEMQRLIEAYGGKEAVKGCRAMVSWYRDAQYYSDDWHGKMATEGGGVLINQAIHTLDLLLYLCGEPTWVNTKRCLPTFFRKNFAFFRPFLVFFL